MNTMTNLLSKERLQGIKEAASDVAKEYGPTWLSSLIGGKNGNYHAITSDHTNDVVVRADDDKRESSWLCDYLESVSPAAVTALIDELLQRREAAGKPIGAIKRICGNKTLQWWNDAPEGAWVFTAPPLTSAERERLAELEEEFEFVMGQSNEIEAENRKLKEKQDELETRLAAYDRAAKEPVEEPVG